MFKHLPVVIAPGFFTSFYPSILNLSKDLEDMGYDVFSPKPSLLSLCSIHAQAVALSQLVDKTLITNKTNKCDIVGIDMGGIVALYYLHELGGAKKVNVCITIGAPFGGTNAAYLTLWFASSAWEIIPYSPLLAYLAKKPKLQNVKTYNFIGANDLLCPPKKSRYKHARNKTFNVGHADLCLGIDKEILNFIDLILNAEKPNI